jgi:hypothetical protein
MKSNKSTFKVTICSPQSEVSFKEINEINFIKWTNQGISDEDYQNILEELNDDSDFSYPLFDIDRFDVLINDKSIEFSIKDIEKIYQLAKDKYDEKNYESEFIPKNTNEKKYTIFNDRYYKRAFYELEINKKFDIKKLSFEIIRAKMPNLQIYEGFIPYYDNDEIEYSWSHNSNEDNLYIFDSRGGSHSIKFTNED